MVVEVVGGGGGRLGKERYVREPLGGRQRAARAATALHYSCVNRRRLWTVWFDSIIFAAHSRVTCQMLRINSRQQGNWPPPPALLSCIATKWENLCNSQLRMSCSFTVLLPPLPLPTPTIQPQPPHPSKTLNLTRFCPVGMLWSLLAHCNAQILTFKLAAAESFAWSLATDLEGCERATNTLLFVCFQLEPMTVQSGISTFGSCQNDTWISDENVSVCSSSVTKWPTRKFQHSIFNMQH